MTSLVELVDPLLDGLTTTLDHRHILRHFRLHLLWCCGVVVVVVFLFCRCGVVFVVVVLLKREGGGVRKKDLGRVKRS